MYSTELENDIVYVSSNETIKSYTGSKKGFIGEENLIRPAAIDKIILDGENGLRRDVLHSNAIRYKFRRI